MKRGKERQTNRKKRVREDEMKEGREEGNKGGREWRRKISRDRGEDMKKKIKGGTNKQSYVKYMVLFRNRMFI